MNRREALNSLAGAIAASGLLPDSARATVATAVAGGSREPQPRRQPYIEAGDGTQLFYQDWGTGKCLLFIHSMCLNSQIWQYNMLPLSDRGFRCVGYDRRGHGRSMQPGRGYDYDTLADDLACVINQLGLHAVTLVGHSMGAGEIVRYLSRHGAERVARIVFVAPGLPFMLKTPDNPEAQERSVSDQVFASWYRDYPGWVASGVPSFVPEMSNAQMEWVGSLCMQASLKALTDCYHAVIETDFRREVAAIRLPTMIVQGDKDTAALIDFTGRRTAQLIKGSQFKVYRGAPHGLMVTHAEQLNNDLAQFVAT
ncbi:MAG TPA: alpha/beta hydrolase [Candidatus Acidoferrum sp.]|nr:alpha/beta hydrolase [Candidatus Acidoferrum sp.]